MLTKADEQKGLEDKCAEQMAEIKFLKALVSFLFSLLNRHYDVFLLYLHSH